MILLSTIRRLLSTLIIPEIEHGLQKTVPHVESYSSLYEQMYLPYTVRCTVYVSSCTFGLDPPMYHCVFSGTVPITYVHNKKCPQLFTVYAVHLLCFVFNTCELQGRESRRYAFNSSDFNLGIPFPVHNEILKLLTYLLS